MNCRELSQTELQQLLVRLGFKQLMVPSESQVVLGHEPTDTLVVLSWIHPERPRPSVVAGVRRLLDEKGILDKDDFDLLAQEIKASPAQRV